MQRPNTQTRSNPSLALRALITALMSALAVAGEPSMAPVTFEDLCEIRQVTRWAQPSNHA